MPRGYNSSETSVHFIGYHFVWCAKYRRKVLEGQVAKRLRELIKQKADDMNCRIISMEVMPDHIHLFIEGSPILTPNKIIGEIKGYSSHQLRKEFKELRTRLPTLWSRSYFVSTHEHVSNKTIEKYIAEQKGM
ncbi:MAG: IS200/IS605 family transposase [Candidatus Micrarchaeaceae archaeon]